MLCRFSSFISILCECSSSCIIVEPFAICDPYVLFVEEFDGFDVSVMIKMDALSLQATPTPILFFDIPRNFLPFFVTVFFLDFEKYVSSR